MRKQWRKYFKTFTSIILICLVILSMNQWIIAYAFAEDGSINNTKSSDEVHKALRDEVAAITVSDDAIVLDESGGVLTGGEYKLDHDTILAVNLSIEQGHTVILDLNGFVLKGTGSGSVISNMGNLTIIDSNPNTEHRGNMSYNAGNFVDSDCMPDGNFGFWGWDLGEDTGSVVINGGIITGGIVKGWSYPGGCGGGIINQGTLIFAGGTVTGNVSQYFGGGIASYGRATGGASFTMLGGAVIYNSSTPYSTSTTGLSYGGGIYIDKSDMIIKGGYIAGNRADGYGGAIFMEGIANTGNETLLIGCGSDSCDGSCIIIENNFAYKGGGAVYVSTAGVNAILQGGSICNNKINPKSDNTSYKDGESFNDVRCNGAHLNITAGNFGFIDNRPWDGSKVAGSINVSGGVINTIINKDGATNISGGKIGYVVAKKGGISNASINITGGLIDSAYSKAGLSYSGSGILITGGNVTMSGGIIQNCKDSKGGGVSVTDGSFTMSGSALIQNCEAVKSGDDGGLGGGVYVAGGNISIYGGTISKCKASNGGGGVSCQWRIFV